ncbi:MAG: helix-hairpin-helix domain-containing protein [Myxococcota bacterium]
MIEETRPVSGRRGAPFRSLAIGLLWLIASAEVGWGALSIAGAVNINTASAEELQLLPGIGPVRAQAILAERKKRTRFNRIEDLADVKGVGESMLDTLRPHVVLVGPTTARQEGRRGSKASSGGGG